MKQKFLLVLVALFCVIFSVNAAVLGDKYVKVMDAFLVKLETYKDNSNYIQLLDSFTLQLNSLKSKYSSNSNVGLMADYLSVGVSDLKSKKLVSDLEDEFIDSLNSWLVSNPSSSSSGGGSFVSSSSSSSSSGGSTSSSTSSSSSSTSSSSSSGGSSVSSSTSSSTSSSSSSSSSGGSSLTMCIADAWLPLTQNCTCPSGTVSVDDGGSKFACLTGNNLYWLYGGYECNGITGVGTRTINGCVIGNDTFTYNKSDGSMSSPATLSTHTFSLNICNKFSVKYPSSAETTANSFTVSSCNPTGASSSCSGILDNGTCYNKNLHWVYATDWSKCSGSSGLGTQTRTIKADNSCYWDPNEQFKYGEEPSNVYPATGMSFGSNSCLQASRSVLPYNTEKPCLNESYRKASGYNNNNDGYTYSQAISYCGNGRRVPTYNEASNFFTYGGLTSFKLNPGAVWTSESLSSGTHRVRYSSGGFNDMGDTMKMGVLCIKDPSSTTTNSSSSTSSSSSSSGGSSSSTTTTTYSWYSGTWSTCTKTCGSGVETREVNCRDSKGTIVADSYCSGTKPFMSQSCNTQACTSSSTSSSSSLTSVCTSGYKEGNTTEIEYYFNNCNPNEKEKNIRVIYKAAGREPDYGGLKNWARNTATGNLLSCTIRLGMRSEQEPIKTKATNLYNLFCK